MKRLPRYTIWALLIFLGLLIIAICIEIAGVNISAPLDSSSAALLGALVGSAVTALVSIYITNKQISSQTEREISSRLFLSRKDAYSKALSIFMGSIHELQKGEDLNSPEEKSREIDDMLAMLTVLSSDELTRQTGEIVKRLGVPMTKAENVRRIEILELLALVRGLAIQMRKELGTGADLGYITGANIHTSANKV